MIKFLKVGPGFFCASLTSEKSFMSSVGIVTKKSALLNIGVGQYSGFYASAVAWIDLCEPISLHGYWNRDGISLQIGIAGFHVGFPKRLSL